MHTILIPRYDHKISILGCPNYGINDCLTTT